MLPNRGGTGASLGFLSAAKQAVDIFLSLEKLRSKISIAFMEMPFAESTPPSMQRGALCRNSNSS